MPSKLTRALARSGAVAIATLTVSGNVSSAQQVTPPPAASSKADLAAMDLEQLMKIEVVFAASKRAQRTRDVPSFVSVVTAAEIKEHGYRTLADILKTLPSFYIANDRNYSYVGVRGFERPGDYNSRVLLLIDGLRINDNIYNQAYLGEELGVDMDVVERIEVIRGPSAAIYGSNAFFAVINIVTKRGASVKGMEVATSAASFGTYGGRATFGQTFAKNLDVLVSGSVSDSKGQNFYYGEYDDPSTNNGLARGVDGESSHKLLANVTKGNFSFQAHSSRREKSIPTGAFGTLFGDKRTHTVDEIKQASASYERSVEQGTSVSTRVHATRWGYHGEYAYDPGVAPNQVA